LTFLRKETIKIADMRLEKCKLHSRGNVPRNAFLPGTDATTGRLLFESLNSREIGYRYISGKRFNLTFSKCD